MKLQGLDKIRAQYCETLKTRSDSLVALTQSKVVDRIELIHRNEEILDIFHTILGGAKQLGFRHLVQNITTIERRIRIHLQSRDEDILGHDELLAEYGDDARQAISDFLDTDEHTRNRYGLDKPSQLAEAKAKEVRIMIIDDDSMMRNLIRSVLLHAGYENVQSVSNAPEACTIAYAIAPDIVICDWKMPGMTGIKLIKSIKSEQNQSMANARFIMLTMIRDMKSVNEAINTGCFDFIAKPFTPKRLMKSVEQAVKDIEAQGGLNRPAPVEAEEIDAFQID